MTGKTSRVLSREILYVSMIIVLIATFIGAIRGASPVYLAVGLIGEIVLLSTAHLSTMIQQLTESMRRPG